jgi:hypothetical protein
VSSGRDASCHGPAQLPALRRAARGNRACDGQWRDDDERPGCDGGNSIIFRKNWEKRKKRLWWDFSVFRVLAQFPGRQ